MDTIAVQGGALLGKGHIFAPPRRAHPAGDILREVPHAHLPHGALRRGNIGAHIPLPPGGRGAGKVYDHAADAVHSRRPGVGVAGLAGDAVHSDGKGIVAAVLLPGQPDAPHALCAAHKGVCAQHGTAVSLVV